MSRRTYTLDDHVKESLHDASFRRAWKDSEVEYQISRRIIEKRLAAKMTQEELARKVHTTQAVISRIENMSGNPTVGMLSRIAGALGTRITVHFE